MKPHTDRSLRWLVRRLARVQRREAVGWARRRLWWRAAEELEDPGGAPGEPWLAVPHGVDPAPLLARAERVLAGEWQGLGQAWETREQPMLWNRDPGSARVFPGVRGDRVRFRRPERDGDIRAVWETARQHPMVWLAQAHALSGDRRYLDGFERRLTWFLDQAPFPMGPCWTSALEVGVRTASWAACWQLLGESGDPALRERWAATARKGLALLEANLSIGSSANNHLIGELGGLVVGGSIWDVDAMQRARPELEAQLLRQIAPDGSSREGSLGYLAFTASWGLLAGIAGGLDDATWQRLADASGFLAAATVGEGTPALGDSDDARVLQLGPEDLSPAAVGRLGCALFGLGDSEEARWWTSVRSVAPRPIPPPRGHYEDAGHVWLGDGSLRALLLAGAIGEDGLGGHGHADALSLLLWHDGAPLLVDPGTGCYLADPVMRACFRGTAAHNTATVDGLDSSHASGLFQWSHRARPEVLASEPRLAHALHRGYERLPDPLVHERRVTLEGGVITVLDTFRCAGPHTVALHWHLAPDLSVTSTADGVRAESRAGSLSIALDPLAREHVRLARGDLDPPLGWHSPRFGAWGPAPVLRQRVAIQGTTTLRTTLTVTNS